MRKLVSAKNRLVALAAGAVLSSVIAACGTGRDISFIGVPSPSATLITSDSTQVKADGVSYATITVEVRDNNSNTLPTGGNAVSLSTSRGTLSSVVDGNNGRYVATLKSTQTGPATVSGTLEGGNIPSTAVIMFVTP
jgi:hypothetical protein